MRHTVRLGTAITTTNGTLKPLGRLAYALALAGGCASTSAAPAFREVAATVEQRTGHEIRWSQAAPSGPELDRAVGALLGKPLTVDAAVQVALLRNPSILAVYEDLSIAQADVVQAGLLSNPVFSAAMTTAERENISPNLILGLTQSFLDIFLIPAKKKIAAAELDAAKFKVASEVLDLAAHVAKAYFAAVAAEQSLRLRNAVAEAERAAFDLSERQREAGNVSDLTAASRRALFDDAQLAVIRAEAERVRTREQLTRLMGLWGKEIAWTSVEQLPDLPQPEPPLDQIESRAVAGRLELSALRSRVAALRHAKSLAETSRFTGILDVGVDVAKLNNGTIVVGPRGSIELPIFDQRQATIARIEAMLRAAEQLWAARAIEVRSEVREAKSRVELAREAVGRYRSEIIPHREQIVALTQQQYDAMLLGVHQLILAKQDELKSYGEYIEAVRDYWIAKVDLEHAMGGGHTPR